MGLLLGIRCVLFRPHSMTCAVDRALSINCLSKLQELTYEKVRQSDRGGSSGRVGVGWIDLRNSKTVTGVAAVVGLG